LLEYVTSDLSVELRNNYVCRFLQLNASTAELKPTESINAAFEVLQNEYSIVGTLENLNSSMRKLGELALFNRPFKKEKLNVTTDRPKKNEVDQTVIDTIAEVNYLDVRLYDLIKEKLAD